MSGLTPLFVALAEVELHLPGARSLKDKRHELRSLIDGLRHRFTLLVVERGHQDLHQRSAIALVALATDAEAARGTLERALNHIHASLDGMVLAERVTVTQMAGEHASA